MSILEVHQQTRYKFVSIQGGSQKFLDFVSNAGLKREKGMKNISDVISKFAIDGTLVDFKPLKQGHIHDTYIGTWMHEGTLTPYIHQEINTHVFPEIQKLMENISRVTTCIKENLKKEKSDEISFSIIPTRTGALYLEDGTKFWRTYQFVEDSETFDLPQDINQAFLGGRTFGKFLKCLSGLDVSNFHETIKGFQDIPSRFKALKQSFDDNRLNRVDTVKKEVNFATSREKFGSVLATALGQRKIPIRITHGDPKFNNILFSKETGKPLCVVDLDTCMPGSLLYDFGDLIRASASRAREDETDLDKVKIDFELYEALSMGFLDGIGDLLNEIEVELMALAPRLIALSLGVRFLTDYLEGDKYFKISHASHNIERCRAQFKLVEDMEGHEVEMKRVIGKRSS